MCRGLQQCKDPQCGGGRTRSALPSMAHPAAAAAGICVASESSHPLHAPAWDAAAHSLVEVQHRAAKEASLPCLDLPLAVVVEGAHQLLYRVREMDGKGEVYTEGY